MIKKRIKIGSHEKEYGLVAFTINTVRATTKLIRCERRRKHTYA